MSGVSNISGTTLSSLLSQGARRPQAAGGSALPQPPAEFKAKFESAAKSAGIDTEQFSSLQSQIQDAVSGALDSFDGRGDPRAAVDDAVNSVLKQNGIDADEFKSKLDSVFEQLGAPKPGSFPGFSGFGSAGGASGVSSFAGASGGFESDQSDLISKLLESLNGGSSDGSSGSSILSALRQLPVGSLVDAQA